MGFVDAGEFTFLGRYVSLCHAHTLLHADIACSVYMLSLYCRLWEGVKDNAQTYCMIGAGVGAGESSLSNTSGWS